MIRSDNPNSPYAFNYINCPVCQTYVGTRARRAAIYCSNKCRQFAYRMREKNLNGGFSPLHSDQNVTRVSSSGKISNSSDQVKLSNSSDQVN